jgi:hypothetical protein
MEYRPSAFEGLFKSLVAIAFSVLVLYLSIGISGTPKLPISVVVCFAGFSIFCYYQQLHWRHFHGANQVFEMFLGLSVVSSTLLQVGFLVYYGFKVAWWSPFALVGLGLVLFPIGLVLERLLTRFGMSMLGFIAWPVFAYLMFKFTPNAV